METFVTLPESTSTQDELVFELTDTLIAVLQYLSTWVLGTEGQAAVYMGTAVVAMTTSLPVAITLARRFGKKNGCPPVSGRFPSSGRCRATATRKARVPRRRSYRC